MKLIFLGPPGAGKGTQAERIAEQFEIAHISTGDMLRAEIRHATPLGAAAKAYIDRGELVPDEVIIGMVENRIKADDCKNGFLLDGFPRTTAQADALGKLVEIDSVVDIEVPFERLVARISGRRMCPDCGAAYHVSTFEDEKCPKCGGALYQRDDDREETVQNRLVVYEKKTAPLIAYYEERGKLFVVNGDAAIDEVTESIVKGLSAK
ncbi:MAG: adenylate kinase [Firmicutes bacterium]|jgi:adenylate kinase|nr:adenylate kinase [Bacillota bacterium]